MSSSGAILLSRQALHPCGKTAWVKSSVAAVKWLKERDFALCSSMGMPTWELITALGSIFDLELELFLPASDDDDFERKVTATSTQFNLNEATTRFWPVFDSDNMHNIRRTRDRLITQCADSIIPVSVRPDGHMNSLIKEWEKAGKTIVRDFITGYTSRDVPLAYTIARENINPEIVQLNDSYLIHWTRASNSAWPTETLLDYYTAIIESDRYPRSAFDTLNNILTTRRIKASSRKMPRRIATVSFSNCLPVEVAKLMTWRARYRMMSFEPYGIGIEKQTALAMNIMPVIYHDRKRDAIPDEQRWLSQSRGKKADWTTEDEYRHRGDFNLSSVDNDKLIVICRTERQARTISARTGLRAIAFTNE